MGKTYIYVLRIDPRRTRVANKTYYIHMRLTETVEWNISWKISYKVYIR